jgi:RNA polymerase sigma-70 factor (ECF subfamily)
LTDELLPGHGKTVSTGSAIASPLSRLPPLPAASRPTLEPLALPPAAAHPETRARAFRVLYEAHVDFVWRNLRRLGVHESDVEDRTQEVFVVAHRRFDEFEDRGHGPRAWLFQIVLRIASDARRHRRRHPEDPDGGDATARASIEPTQAETVARQEALSRLDAALDTIDVGRRAVLVLHEIEEMTAPEIASVLGIPLNTVYSRLRVARVELEAVLARQGGER